MLIAAARMKEWYALYKASIISPAANTLSMEANVVQLDTSTLGNGFGSQNPAAWTFQLSDGAADFGLDILFADPLPFDNSMSLNPMAFEVAK